MNAIAKKRTLAILSLALAMSCLAGCSSSGSGGGSSSQGEGKPSTGSTADSEPMELWIGTNWPEKLNENQQIRKLLEEKYQVKFVFAASPDKEAVNLQIASGDMPDYIRDFTFPEYHAFADQGVIAELPIETVKQYAPGLSTWIEKWGGGENVWNYFDHNGKNYTVPGLWSLANNGLVLCYREDLLQKAGVQKLPETLDEMDAALRAMKDTLGIAPLSGSGLNSLSHIYGAFDVYQTYYEKDGKMVFGGIEPAAKEALALLNGWYQDGLLDPEFMINKAENIIEKWGKDEAAVYEFYWWDFLPKEAFFDGRWNEVIKDKQGASNAIVLPPKGKDGAQGITQGNSVGGPGLQFSQKLESQPEKIKKYLEVFDGSFDREVSDWLYYGVEGETYNYDQTKGLEWIAPYDQEEKRAEYGINLYLLPGCFNDYDLQAKYMTQPQYLELRQQTEQKGIGKYNLIEPFYRPVFNQKNEVLNKLYTNAHIDFITGVRPLDEFDDFVEEWLASGGKEVLAEAQDVYDNQYNK